MYLLTKETIFTKSKANPQLQFIYRRQARTSKPTNRQKLFSLFLLGQLTINARNPSIEIASC
jgi:hypothetical protein